MKSIQNEKIIRIGNWLFNPFVYVAGYKALFIGLFLIIVYATAGYYNEIKFDAVVGLHTCVPSDSVLKVLAEAILIWLSISFVFVLIALVVSETSFRVIDVFGTMALAKWPSLILSFFMFMPGISGTCIDYSSLSIFRRSGSMTYEGSLHLIFYFLSIFVLIWTLILIFNAFRVSSNMKGNKAIFSFGAGIFISILVKHYLMKDIVESLFSFMGKS